MRAVEEKNHEAYNYSVHMGHTLDPLYESIKNYISIGAIAYFQYLDDGSFFFSGAGSKEAHLLRQWYFLSEEVPIYGSKSHSAFIRRLSINENYFNIYPCTKAQHNDSVLKLLNYHGFKTGCGFCKKNSNSIEEFRFLLTNYYSAQFLIKQADTFLAIVKHLREKYRDVLYSNSHIMSKSANNIACELFKETAEAQNKKAFLNFLDQHNIVLKTLHYLSPQEHECLKLMVNGNTMRASSQLLNLSARTIETYIENVKVKTGCNFKSELIDRFFYYFQELRKDQRG